MPIELHTWNTPNGRKISVALEEMGLPYSVHPVNISKGEQFAPGFVKISPNSKIPAIVDPEGPDGQPISIFESGAILIYLGEKTGKFWPADRRRQVPVLEWLMWQMGGFGPMPGQVHHFLQVISIADFAILGWAWRHERHQVDLADFPNVQRWYATMMARAGTKRGFEVALS